MDWGVYWFMLPVCVVVASVAMFSGISGAAMLVPVFLIGFPLVGAPRLGTVAAIGTSLFLETSGFGMGVYRYTRMRLVDASTARVLILFSLPAGALGAVLARFAPVQALRLGYGAGMLVLAWLLWRGISAHGHPEGGVVAEGGRADDEPCPEPATRRIESADGTTYAYCARGLDLQCLLSGVGGFLAGLISTGVGEATLPGLVRRSRFPVPVAAATSTMVVAGTVVGAAATHLVQLGLEGGFTAIPWNLIVWAVPGALIGATIGTRLQGRIPERASRAFFGALFGAVGVTFLVGFTAFRSHFG